MFPSEFTVVVADDEHLARERLVLLLGDFPTVRIVAQAANGQEALQQCQQLQPDIALLDIRMPEMNGLEVAACLAQEEHGPCVIFTTAFDQFALPAFESNAIDYLLKPIAKERLLQALQKAQKYKAHLAQPTVHSQPQEVLTAAERQRHVCVNMHGQTQFIPTEDIFYFLAEHKYVTIRHVQGIALSEESLISLEQRFAAQFLRIHRNALVSKHRLRALEKTPEGLFTVSLQGLTEKIEVSRRHWRIVKNYMKNQ